MNCQEFETIVSELVRAMPTEASLRESGLAHAATCEQCNFRLTDERSLTAGLKAFAASSENSAAPQQLEAALLAAFRQQGGTAPQTNVVAFPVKHSRTRVWVFAAAAAILIAALTFAASQLLKESHSIEPVITLTPGPSVIPRRTPEQKRNDVAIDILELGEKPSNKPRRKRLPRPPVKERSQVIASLGEFTPVFGSPENGQEVATDFFPLGHEPASEPLESGQLIRVQMPRSALASFGLPVNYERANVPVKADVLLAEDGSARAIRFVR
jgi:7,8-dihydro-6-hydroxymethylpterin-pyrophosphokinase